jgi:hypothetical protein
VDFQGRNGEGNGERLPRVIEGPNMPISFQEYSQYVLGRLNIQTLLPILSSKVAPKKIAPQDLAKRSVMPTLGKQSHDCLPYLSLQVSFYATICPAPALTSPFTRLGYAPRRPFKRS